MTDGEGDGPDSDSGFRSRGLARLRRAGRALYGVAFGDRCGAALFLGALAFFGLYWRVGVFITDTYTVANAAAAVSEGSLSVDRIAYGPASGETPGMVVAGGERYGRNYGQVFLALPAAHLLRGLALVADLRLAVVGLWCLSLLGCFVLLGRITGRRRAFALAGSGVVLALFGANLAVATELEARWIPLAALQLSSMTAAAMTAVLLYRLVRRIRGRRTGMAAGAAVAFASPVGFWAPLPKRHASVAALVVAVAYCLYRTREAETAAGPDGRARRRDRRRRALGFRALAYGLVGFCAWIQPAEALALLVALVPADLLTARSTGRRELAAVGGAFGLSLLPFLLTNYAMSGNPLLPPRLLPRYAGEALSPTSAVEGPGRGTGALGDGSVDAASDPLSASASADAGGRRSAAVALARFLGRVGATAIDNAGLFWRFMARGVDALLDGDRLYRTFVRSGYVDSVAPEDGNEAISLSLLESMPLLGAALALPGHLALRLREDPGRSGRSGRSGRPGARARREVDPTPARAVDLFSLAFAGVLTLLYLPRLPLHATVTVRYLVPAVPALAYLLTRLEPVRSAARAWRTMAWAYAATVLVGGQLLLLATLLRRPALGEAMQGHALLALAAALCLGVWGLSTASTARRSDRLGAVLLGAVGGVATAFLLLSGVVHFSAAGEFALPAVRVVSEALSAA
ncbi:hypothetical protein [Halegenticoccus soli]|uniref:hypothetical protein n=1 Tax=Halegenticoccus soli TaxID=1985678 RepID=UPI000C6DD88C|nr:hypothetical protein [Halegenticoccus soli]